MKFNSNVHIMLAMSISIIMASCDGTSSKKGVADESIDTISLEKDSVRTIGEKSFEDNAYGVVEKQKPDTTLKVIRTIEYQICQNPLSTPFWHLKQYDWKPSYLMTISRS